MAGWKESRASLDSAEQELRSFLRQNKSYANSPDLTFDERRLERGVTLQRQLFTSLAPSRSNAFEWTRFATTR